jgi:hypothetical protein
MPYTYAEVRASYSGDKAYQERHDVVTRFFSRPLSFPVAWAALRLGLTPNHVTWISLVMNIAGLGLMATGNRLCMAWGVVVILAALVLDAADGNMARTTRRFSPFGEWLEGVGAYLLCAGFHLAGGIGAWRAILLGNPVTQWPPPSLVAAAQAGWLIAWGGIAAAGITVSILAAGKFSAAFPSVDRGQVVARKGEGFYGMLFTIGRNLSFASGLVLPFSLLGILIRRYELVLGGFAVLNMAMLLAVLVRCGQLGSRAMSGRHS